MELQPHNRLAIIFLSVAYENVVSKIEALNDRLLSVYRILESYDRLGDLHFIYGLQENS